MFSSALALDRDAIAGSHPAEGISCVGYSRGFPAIFPVTIADREHISKGGSSDGNKSTSVNEEAGSLHLPRPVTPSNRTLPTRGRRGIFSGVLSVMPKPFFIPPYGGVKPATWISEVDEMELDLEKFPFEGVIKRKNAKGVVEWIIYIHPLYLRCTDAAKRVILSYEWDE